VDFVIPEGFTVDPEHARLHAAIEAKAKALGCSYVDALRLFEKFRAPAGFRVDEARLAIFERAREICAGDGVENFAATAILLEQTGGCAPACVADPRAVVLGPNAHERGLPAMIHLNAAASVTREGFSGCAYSGGVIAHGGESLFAIDLDGIAMPPGGNVSLLVNHDGNRIAGRARAEVTDGALYLRDGRFSRVTAAGREAAGLHDEGHPLKLSVGVSGESEYLSRPTSMLLNGRQQTVATVMRKARLLEVSIVPAGADPLAALA
jgi:hypothetical protein